MPLPSLINRKSGSPYSSTFRFSDISNRPFSSGLLASIPFTEATVGRLLTIRIRIRVLGESLMVVGWKFATYRSRSPSFSMSASVMDMLPALEPSPAFFVTSVNDSPVSFRNNLVPPPREFTSKSKSPSPSTSAKAAAVESCPAQPTLASFVISTNFQPPRLRYNLFSLSSPQKYKSHHPSLSISPAATPEPLSRFRLRMDRSLPKRFRKSIPVSADFRRLNPGAPKRGTSNLLAAHDLP